MKIVYDINVNKYWCFFDTEFGRRRVIYSKDNLKTLLKLHNIVNLKYSVVGNRKDLDFDIRLIKRNCLEKI